MNWQTIKEKRWYKKTKAVFSQGLTPWEMALSIVLGAFWGVIPLIGIATPAITFSAIYFRLNLPLALFMTYAVSPLHVLLFLPFIYAGEAIVGAEHLPITFERVQSAFQEDFMAALSDLSLQLGHGLVGWITIGIPVSIALFFLIYYILKYNPRSRKKEAIES